MHFLQYSSLWLSFENNNRSNCYLEYSSQSVLFALPFYPVIFCCQLFSYNQISIYFEFVCLIPQTRLFACWLHYYDVIASPIWWIYSPNLRLGIFGNIYDNSMPICLALYSIYVLYPTQPTIECLSTHCFQNGYFRVPLFQDLEQTVRGNKGKKYDPKISISLSQLFSNIIC